MVARVDTTNITRGLEFSIYVHTENEPTITLYAFNATDYSYEEIQYTLEKKGVMYIATAKAPYFDGYLLGKINGKSLVVKKIGHPRPHFVVGYKENYTVFYKLYNELGEVVRDSSMSKIVDGFYYCEVPSEITIIETLKKRFILKDNLTKINYGVNLGDATLDDVDLPNYSLDATLGDATLEEVILEDVEVNATLANLEITEY